MWDHLLNLLLLSFQPFSMESLNKAMDGAKKQQSIQGFLMEQMAKITGQGSGGNGGNNNRYGGSGGGPDGPDDESFTDSLYEVVQVVLATVAFVLTVISLLLSCLSLSFILKCYICNDSSVQIFQSLIMPEHTS